MKNLKYFLSIFLSLFCCSVFAQESPVVEIDKIVVTDTQNQSEHFQTQPSTSIPIKTTAPTSDSVADVVSRISGVHLRRYGGLEDSTSVSIRGSSSDQVQVFLDGVPLDTASGQGIGLGQMMSSSLSKIEIYKTQAPLELGGSAMGGTVNLQSKQIEKGTHQRFGLGYGSFSTLDAIAELMRGGVAHDWMMGVDFKKTAGDFSFLDNNGTPVNPADDQTVERQNNHSQTVHPYFKWNYRMDDRTDLLLSNHFYRTDSGVPGLGSFQSLNASLDQTEWLSSLQFTRRGYFKDKGTLSNRFYLRWICSQFSDPNGEIGLGAVQDNDDHTWVVGDSVSWQTDFSKIFSLKNGIEAVAEWYQPKNYAVTPSAGSTSKREQLNFFVEPHFSLWDDKILLSFMGQSLNAFYGINDNDPSFTTPGTYFSQRHENDLAGTVSLQYFLFPQFYLKTSGGRVVRLPKFVEMFGDQGTVLGNPQLLSESGLKFDVGFSWTKNFPGWFKQLHVESNYFATKTDNLIQFEQINGYARASNVGKADVHGVEFISDFKFARHFGYNFNYTYQQAKDQSVYPGNFLIGRPEHEFNTGLQFNYKQFNSAVDVNFIDRQYLDALNTQRVNNRFLVNANAGYLFKEKYRVGIEAKNITNSQVVDAIGFPLAGRSFFGRLDVFF